MVAALLIIAYAVPYAVRARVLARRGRPVPRRRIACFVAGIAVLALATSAPVGALAEERLTAHMAEHLLIGDVASLLLVLGLTGPVLAPVLRVPVANHLRRLAHPAPVFALWALNLWLWHLPFAYEAALRHDVVHAAQHACFLFAGIGLWMPLFGPFARPAWFGSGAMCVYVVAIGLTGALLGNLLAWSGTALYPSYGSLSDQSAAGAVMMVEQSAMIVALLAWLLSKWLRESGERQELAELAAAYGVPVDERRIARAVAAGRAEELRRRVRSSVGAQR
jgi:cytochrome c oxidase assembly factor CtaG